MKICTYVPVTQNVDIVVTGYSRVGMGRTSVRYSRVGMGRTSVRYSRVGMGRTSVRYELELHSSVSL